MKKTEQIVLKFIDGKKLINKGDNILIALSGGPDSVFLLRFLSKYKRRFKINLGALHINHRLRGKDSEEDAKFCEQLCKQYNVKYYSKNKNVKSFAAKNKLSLEEAGREIRYTELKTTAKKYGFNKIATAHNSGDNTETILLNLIKGTGIDGIAGIPIKRDNIIRPILCLKKEDILDYLKKSIQKYRLDKTNLDVDYERNFIRNNILPLIKEKLNPSVEDSIFKSSEVFKEIKDIIKKDIYIDNPGFIIKARDEIRINIDKDTKPDKLNFIIKDAIQNNFHTEINFKNIKDISGLLSKRIGQRIDLQRNLMAIRERGYILIKKNNEEDSFISLSIKPNNEVTIKSKKLAIKKVSNPKNIHFTNNKNFEFIAADKIKGSFEIRRWKSGDKFCPVGFNGSKKLSDYLTEQKIPNAKRKEQLVLTNNNKIVWVLGLRLDNRFKISTNTKKVYSLCLK